jgi:hypothetical protein
MEPIIILCFSPWKPYLKTDKDSHHILFFIMDPKHCSMKILWKDSIKKMMELMLDNRLIARPVGMSGK